MSLTGPTPVPSLRDMEIPEGDTRPGYPCARSQAFGVAAAFGNAKRGKSRGLATGAVRIGRTRKGHDV